MGHCIASCGKSRRYTENLGGNWTEFALGGTYNFRKDWTLYGEADMGVGGPAKRDYQFSIGVRHSF